MKVRSLNELTDTLSDDLVRRKREMSSIKLLIDEARPHEQHGLRRAAFAMLYAHWEGFIRLAGTAYLGFVGHKGLRFADLKPNFTAASLKSKLQDLGEISKATIVTATVQQLIYNQNDIASFGWAGEVDCRSNLNSEVLAEITCLLGIPFSNYEMRGQFLDNTLLANRNDIAHGRMVQVEANDFLTAHETVLNLIEQFRTDIENAAAAETYRR